jgi:hypothetical protein
MNRRHFISTSLVSGIALTLFPQLAFQNSTLSTEELIGKGNPLLFGEGYKLRKEAHEAFLEMKTEALKSDISIKVVSSYRSFEHQKRIWERKYRQYTSQGMTNTKAIHKIIEYSTIPGTSRHHWGTELDLIDANTPQPRHLLAPKNFVPNGSFYTLKQWMEEHANAFGFYLAYTNNPDRKGFKYEPWHYSYKPLSASYLNTYKTLNLSEIFEKEQLLGSDYFSESFMNQYNKENILDINPKLL